MQRRRTNDTTAIEITTDKANAKKKERDDKGENVDDVVAKIGRKIFQGSGCIAVRSRVTGIKPTTSTRCVSSFQARRRTEILLAAQQGELPEGMTEVNNASSQFVT